MILSAAALRRLIKTKGKRMDKYYAEYLNKKLEKIVLGHIHMLGSRGTLRAKDYIFLDAVNKGG
jgi:hypothetical protein